MPRPKRPRKVYPCAFPGCVIPSTEFHHITYKPVSGRRLCRNHHIQITAININAAFSAGRKLSNKHRWFLFGRWLKGEVTPVYDRHVVAWLARWHS